MPRIALGLEYDGSRYCGWQTQAHAPSVQDQVEKALSKVADHAVSVTSAGRTDRGVHASMQVVHFDAAVDRGERAWVLGANTEMNADISALWARQVSDEFHARYGAQARTYRYLILNRASRPALDRERAGWVRQQLNAEHMNEAAQALVGEHDFTSLRAAECQSSTPMRRLDRISVARCEEFVTIVVTANAFLHHMVRNIAGVLIAIGTGDRPVSWCGEVLEAKDRRLAGITAPPQGLTLIGVRYPAEFGLPTDIEGATYLERHLPAAQRSRIDAAGYHTRDRL
jgi:tRNA pseudouridine38-40 synthase